MKIAVMGEIHSDGLKVLENNNLEYFEISDFEQNNLKKDLENVDGIIIRTANLNSEVLNCCKKLKISSFLNPSPTAKVTKNCTKTS